MLPNAPAPIGTIRRALGNGARPFQVVIRAEASPSVAAGDTADIVLTIASRGRTGTVTLPLTLNMDYEIVDAVSAFDAGIETFDRFTSTTVPLWTHEPRRDVVDYWDIEACAGVGGTAGARNGRVGCSDYVDCQVAATLVSPPIFPLPPDAVAYGNRVDTKRALCAITCRSDAGTRVDRIESVDDSKRTRRRFLLGSALALLLGALFAAPLGADEYDNRRKQGRCLCHTGRSSYQFLRAPMPAPEDPPHCGLLRAGGDCGNQPRPKGTSADCWGSPRRQWREVQHGVFRARVAISLGYP